MKILSTANIKKTILNGDITYIFKNPYFLGLDLKLFSNDFQVENFDIFNKFGFNYNNIELKKKNLILNSNGGIEPFINYMNIDYLFELMDYLRNNYEHIGMILSGKEKRIIAPNDDYFFIDLKDEDKIMEPFSQLDDIYIQFFQSVTSGISNGRFSINSILEILSNGEPKRLFEIAALLNKKPGVVNVYLLRLLERNFILKNKEKRYFIPSHHFCKKMTGCHLKVDKIELNEEVEKERYEKKKKSDFDYLN
jgi:hypothetical protein